MRITPIQQIVFTGRPEDSNKRSRYVQNNTQLFISKHSNTRDVLSLNNKTRNE